MSGADLSWFIDDTVARALQAQKGVAQVGRVGGVDREINVVLDPDRMARLRRDRAAGERRPAPVQHRRAGRPGRHRRARADRARAGLGDHRRQAARR